MEEHGLIFITGGARSGKSTFAERYATTYVEKNGGNLIYVATSRVEDTEMEQRIARHQEQRGGSGYHWKTIECPVNLSSIVDKIGKRDVVLIDCLTVLLTNELFSSGKKESDGQRSSQQQTMTEKIISGIEQIQKQAQLLIVVSNEVLNEPILNNTLVHTYSKLLGELHQIIVWNADEAYLVEAGIPIEMKGGIST